MYEIALQDASVQFAEIINDVAHGDEVRIRRDDGKVFKIVLVHTQPPFPKFGSARGLIEIADDFDEPLEDFREYMP